jgi:pilus assembly protein CpaE
MPEKILIVDDDLDTLKLVGLILQRHGFQIAAANGGLQALTKVATERPDIILLDLMMPDLDGYEVTRRIRADTTIAHIPIIMFTAKTMLDDKVAGFEAGADDYLTKPTHPSELVAHVKALLSRAGAARAAATSPIATARVVSFIAAKGGVGTSTVALNFAAAAAQTGQDVVLADLHSGSGSLGLMLGLAPKQTLSALITRPVGELDQRAITDQISAHASGVRVLASAPEPNETTLANNASQIEAIVKIAGRMCKLLALDLGSGLSEAARRVVPLSDLVIIVSEPTRLSITQSKALVASLTHLGVPNTRIELVIVNRTPSTLQMSWQQAEQMLGTKVAAIVTPAPELAYQAVEAGTPIVLLRADSLTADQLRKMTNQLIEKLNK